MTDPVTYSEILDPSKHDLGDACETPFLFDLRKHPSLLNPHASGGKLAYTAGTDVPYTRGEETSHKRATLAAHTYVYGDLHGKGPKHIVEGVNFGNNAVIVGAIKVGDDTVLGACTSLGEGVDVGDNCDIGPYSLVNHRARIGDRSILRNNSTIGTDVTVGTRFRLGFGANVGKNFTAGPEFGVRRLMDEPKPNCYELSVDFPPNVKIPTRTTFGDNFKCGPMSTFESPIIDDAERHQYEFGAGAEIGVHTRVYGDALFRCCTNIGAGTWFKGRTTFVGSNTVIGNDVEFEGPVFVEHAVNLGAAVKFNNGLYWRGHEILRFMSLANVDGTGRQVIVFLARLGKDRTQVLVHAGCFFGSAVAFCNKADSEGKPVYVEMITAAANALRAAHKAAARKRTKSVAQ